MTDVFPALELSVAALTFVLGFVSARHHSYLGSARDLVNRMGGELQSPTRHASRDRSRELLMLAQRGLATDYVVLSTVIVSWVWVGLTTWLAIWAASQDALGGGGQPKAATPVLIAMLVASLGTWDFIAVQQQLRMLRTRTTVGLLATAASAADQREFDDVIPVATLAAARPHRSAQ